MYIFKKKQNFIIDIIAAIIGATLALLPFILYIFHYIG